MHRDALRYIKCYISMRLICKMPRFEAILITNADTPGTEPYDSRKGTGHCGLWCLCSIAGGKTQIAAFGVFGLHLGKWGTEGNLHYKNVMRYILNYILDGLHGAVCGHRGCSKNTRH